jgi:cardiolipin synthase
MRRTMETATWITIAAFVTDLLIRIGLSVRVIMRRRPVGVSLAWLSIILMVPFAGAVIYLFVGELRLGTRRAEWAAKIHKPYERWLNELRNRWPTDESLVGNTGQPLAQLTERAVAMPALPGNDLTLMSRTDEVFTSIIADIDAARWSCHIEFYIWNVGGLADDVAEALLRARARGVICRVLVDAVGSSRFLRSDLAMRLREGGIILQAALPVGLMRMLFVRFDLRLHRKIIVIDGETAYTGSLNMVDPRFFKQDAGVGQWVDAMVRVRGPAVEGLAVTFLEDWELETGEGVERLAETGNIRALEPCGASSIQVVPSGPSVRTGAITEILLMAIYAARHEIILTTPYFVPDEALLTALISAANRGVDVTIIVPDKVDSRLVRLASQAHQGDLLMAGVRVAQFHSGLLHTKSITVDGQFSLFGSLNLDPRSLHLNFEITLIIYDPHFTTELRALQKSYIDQSQWMDLAAWQARSRLERFSENTARLLGPLL